ncbi:MAG: tRNA (guanine-N(1)-)-methyltransferase [Chlamydiae bacterium]|nr:tRNA (guanine-N(1)-)-methyltransferase [Chlamydiota bacterium]
MDIEILSLFPDYFKGPFEESILKRAQEKQLLSFRHVNLRNFAFDRAKRVDDRPYGGGPGMVLKPEPVARAIGSVRRSDSHVVYLSPQGRVLTAGKCQELAQKSHLILLCGHYEGVDERVLEEEVDEEISIGDYVLTNGGLAALVLIDSVARFIPGVLGHEEAALQDSFQEGLLDCPHYTRPERFGQRGVPEVLREGNHAKVAAWRKAKAVEKTKRVRPDLYLRYLAEKGEETRKFLSGSLKEIALSCGNDSSVRAFYRKILGFEEREERLHAPFIGTSLVLIEGENTSPTFLVVEVEKEIFATWVRRLRRAQIDYYVTSEGSDTYLTFCDPAGHRWQVSPKIEG